MRTESVETAAARETCILVGVEITTRSSSTADESAVLTMDESLAELRRLADTAGMDVVGMLTQTLSNPVAGTYIGKGKIGEIKAELKSLESCTVVFDVELTPSNQRCLERAFGGEKDGIKVLDRTALILDIFALAASTREGILQTELALYEYRRPRLTRMWTHLERQTGGKGVGLRGIGETQLEVDRRAVSNRIVKLSREIDGVRAHRQRHREARRSSLPYPVVALVGYTNSGKTSLLNFLTGADAHAEDRLFATLDPKTRRALMPGVKLSPEMLITDTVGFVSKLPTQLVAAFRATLEEVTDADVLVHVVDASVGKELAVAQMKVVMGVLAEIGAKDKPGVIALNKTDVVEEAELQEIQESIMESSVQDIVPVAAITGHGVPELGRLLDDVLRDILVPVDCVVPFSHGNLISAIYEQGSVDFEDFPKTGGTHIEAYVPRSLQKRLAPFAVSDRENSNKIQEGSQAYWERLARKRSVD